MDGQSNVDFMTSQQQSYIALGKQQNIPINNMINSRNINQQVAGTKGIGGTTFNFTSGKLKLKFIIDID